MAEPNREGLSISQQAELVDRARNGDSGAYGELYKEHSPAMFKLALTVVEDVQVAEDITADTFERAAGKLDQYQHQGHPVSSWLYRLLRNQIVNHYRGERRTRPLEAAVEVAQSTGDGSSLEAAEARADINPIFARLNPEQVAVLQYRFMKDMSVEETAAEMGKSEDAVKKLQRRGLIAARSILDPSYIPPTRTRKKRASNLS